MQIKECSVYWIHSANHCDIFNEGYIGITKDLKRRINEHVLRSTNKHVLKNMDEDYDDCIFSLIFTGTCDKCLQIEEKLRPKHFIGWNINPGGRYEGPLRGGSKLGVLKSREHRMGMTNKLVSDTTKDIIRQQNIGKKQSKETSKKRSLTISETVWWHNKQNTRTRCKYRPGLSFKLGFSTKFPKEGTETFKIPQVNTILGRFISLEEAAKIHQQPIVYIINKIHRNVRDFYYVDI